MKSNFFLARAVCKFSNCFKFRFHIKTIPDAEARFISVSYATFGCYSALHDDSCTSHSRHLSGLMRLQTALQVNQDGVSNYFHKQFNNTKTMALVSRGNLTDLKSKSSLSKAKLEYLSSQRFSEDNWDDLILLQKNYVLQNTGRNLVSGYIQYLAREPFVVHMFTEKQLEVLKNFKSHPIILHLDATGSLIRKIDPNHKNVFYYALTIQHPSVNTSPIPLAEMISSDHTTAEISHFLNKWFLTCKSIHGKSINIAQIEIDFSWAMIHSVVGTINNTNIIHYLDNCWTYCTSKLQNRLNFCTIIHICSAHLLHNLSYKLKRKFKLDKYFKKFILYILRENYQIILFQ